MKRMGAVAVVFCFVGAAFAQEHKKRASPAEEMAALKKALKGYRQEVEAALKRNPDNWMAAARAVFIHEVFAERARRDAAIRHLYELRSQGKVPADDYLRDQFVAKNQMVQVREYFELKGKRAKKYVFVLMEPDGTVTTNLSLGSYARTNAIISELEGRTKPVFHLDGYYQKGKIHKTYRFYDDEPSYDAVRKDIIAVLEGKMSSISGTNGKHVEISP